MADHIRRYVASQGEDGHIWRRLPTLLVTTTGRKSGLRRQTALFYGRDGDRYVIAASKGGHPSYPLWYENLVMSPLVELQVGADVFEARAISISEGKHFERLWGEMVSIWPGFNEYKLKTARRNPLVILK